MRRAVVPETLEAVLLPLCPRHCCPWSQLLNRQKGLFCMLSAGGKVGEGVENTDEKHQLS